MSRWVSDICQLDDGRVPIQLEAALYIYIYHCFLHFPRPRVESVLVKNKDILLLYLLGRNRNVVNIRSLAYVVFLYTHIYLSVVPTSNRGKGAL